MNSQTATEAQGRLLNSFREVESELRIKQSQIGGKGGLRCKSSCLGERRGVSGEPFLSNLSASKSPIMKVSRKKKEERSMSENKDQSEKVVELLKELVKWT